MKSLATVSAIFAAGLVFTMLESSLSAQNAPPPPPPPPPASGPALVDSPDFLGWKNFPVGSTVTMKITGLSYDDKAKETKSENNATAKLIESTAEKVVLEFNYTIDENGKKEQKTEKFDIPAKTPKETVMTPQQTGKEDIKVGDKTFKCQWEQTVDKQGPVTITLKKWTSPEVPGGAVRQVITTEQDGKITSQTTFDLVEFKKP